MSSAARQIHVSTDAAWKVGKPTSLGIALRHLVSSAHVGLTNGVYCSILFSVVLPSAAALCKQAEDKPHSLAEARTCYEVTIVLITVALAISR